MTTNKKIDIENENICLAEQELEIPNAETIAAIKEVAEMKKNPSLYKKYSNAAEMLRDVLR